MWTIMHRPVIMTSVHIFPFLCMSNRIPRKTRISRTISVSRRSPLFRVNISDIKSAHGFNDHGQFHCFLYSVFNLFYRQPPSFDYLKIVLPALFSPAPGGIMSGQKGLISHHPCTCFYFNSTPFPSNGSFILSSRDALIPCSMHDGINISLVYLYRLIGYPSLKNYKFFHPTPLYYLFTSLGMN